MFKRALLHNWKLVPCATTKSAYYFSWRAHNEVISQEMQYLEGWWASPGKTGWQQPPGRPPSPFSFRSPDLQSSIIPWRPGLTWPHSISYRLSAAKHAMNHRRYGRCYVYLIKYRFPLPSFFYLFICLFGWVLSKERQQFCQQMKSVTPAPVVRFNLVKDISSSLITGVLDLGTHHLFFFGRASCFWLEALAGGAKRKRSWKGRIQMVNLYFKSTHCISWSYISLRWNQTIIDEWELQLPELTC